MSDSPLDTPLLPSRTSFDSISLGSFDSRFRGVPNLDEFLQNVYVYWLHHGYWPYVIRQLLQVITLGLVLLILLLLTCFIDYGALFSTDTELLDAFTLRAPHPIVWLLLIVSLIALVIRVIKMRHDLMAVSHTRVFLNQVLLVSDEQLAHMSWEDVMGLLLPVYEQLQGHNHNVNTDALLARLMRVEQFIIALSKADLLSLHIFHGWPDCILSLPFLGGLWIALLPLLNDRDSLDTEPQLRIASRNLQWRVTLLGLGGLLISPFALILVLVYYACRYGERVRSAPSFFGTRHWSLRAQWCTRNYNELPHHVRARLESAESAAQQYIGATVNRMVPAVAQFGLFLCSTVCVLILGLALVDDDLLLHKTFLGRVLMWWLALAASGVAACRMMDPSDQSAGMRQHNVPQLVTELATHLQVHPEHVRCHMRSYYEHRVAGFLWELASVVLAPLLFLCMLRGRCDHIVAFVRAHSRVEFGMGRVLHAVEK
jgi:autophagy-related protein 9